MTPYRPRIRCDGLQLDFKATAGAFEDGAVTRKAVSGRPSWAPNLKVLDGCFEVIGRNRASVIRVLENERKGTIVVCDRLDTRHILGPEGAKVDALLVAALPMAEDVVVSNVGDKTVGVREPPMVRDAFEGPRSLFHEAFEGGGEPVYIMLADAEVTRLDATRKHSESPVAKVTVAAGTLIVVLKKTGLESDGDDTRGD